MKRPLVAAATFAGVSFIAIGGLSACKPKELAGTKGVALPSARAAGDAPGVPDFKGHVLSYAPGRGLAIDDRAVPMPEATHGALMIATLRDAVKPLPKDSILLAIDGATPYRTVTSILFTLGQSEVSTFRFLVKKSADAKGIVTVEPPRSGESICIPGSVQTGAVGDSEMGAALSRQADDLLAQLQAIDNGRPRAAPVDAGPSAVPIPIAKRRALCVSVRLLAESIDVRSGTDVLAPGCAEVAKPGGHTIPSRTFTRLAECAQRLHGDSTASARATRVTLTAVGDVPWRDLIAAHDALRDANGDPLLGEIALAVAF